LSNYLEKHSEYKLWATGGSASPGSTATAIMAPGLDLSLLAHELDHADHSPLPHKASKPASATPSKGTIVLHPSNVTTEFDLLRFEAAAFGQLHVNGIDNGNRNMQSYHLQTSSLLISSPYNNPGHYLDLMTLDTPDLLFSKALTALKPLRPDYATAPYTEALDFSAVLEAVRHFAKDEQFAWKEHTFYVVVFRSKLKDSIPNDLLYQLDYESHREACESGGLLKYWFGKPDEERKNLATCEYFPDTLPRANLYQDLSPLQFQS
jgi:hypothetical protein